MHSVNQSSYLQIARQSYRSLDQLDRLGSGTIDRGRGVSVMSTQPTPNLDEGRHVDVYRGQ